MKGKWSSWTSVFAAAKRGIESEKPEGERICYDPFAKQFIGPLYYFFIKRMIAFQQRNAPFSQQFIVYRSRFFDDAAMEAIASGTTQLVILGAGLDSKAYREEFSGKGVRVFEVDHPVTQATKIRRVKRLFRTIPEQVVFVPIDFLNETLDKLLAYGFNRSEKTLFLWEGVIYYLTLDAVNSVLQWVSSNVAKGSGIIFDYKYQSNWEKNGRRKKNITRRVADITGEIRSLHLEKKVIKELLTQKGFTVLQELDGEQLANQYRKGANPRRRVSRNCIILHAGLMEATR
jgi:methyltransferase (TIGR00027 family)